MTINFDDSELGRELRVVDDIDPIEMLTAKVDNLQNTLDQILTIFNEIKDQAEPLINGISNSPMLKMIGVKL